MCDVNDVIKNSTKSATEIVSTLYECGENSLDKGIRKVANVAYQKRRKDNMLPILTIVGGIVAVMGVTTWTMNKFIKKRKTIHLHNT